MAEARDRILEARQRPGDELEGGGKNRELLYVVHRHRSFHSVLALPDNGLQVKVYEERGMAKVEE